MSSQHEPKNDKTVEFIALDKRESYAWNETEIFYTPAHILSLQPVWRKMHEK